MNPASFSTLSCGLAEQIPPARNLLSKSGAQEPQIRSASLPNGKYLPGAVIRERAVNICVAKIFGRFMLAAASSLPLPPRHCRTTPLTVPDRDSAASGAHRHRRAGITSHRPENVRTAPDQYSATTDHTSVPPRHSFRAAPLLPFIPGTEPERTGTESRQRPKCSFVHRHP